MYKKLLLGLLCSAGLSACFNIQKGKEFKHVAPGAWRGVFMTDTSSRVRLPVSFEVLSDEHGMPKQLAFINGSERVLTDSIRFWGDTAFFYFQKSQAYFRVIYEINLMEGALYDQTQAEYPLQFQAQAGTFPRFPDIRREPAADVSGEWTMQLGLSSTSAETGTDSLVNGKIQLKADKNQLTGLLTIPNYPPLQVEGTIQGTQFYLSGFDGRRATLISGVVPNANTIQKGSLKINYKEWAFQASK